MTRLNLNLREDKGYTYGAFSTLALLSRAGYWYASASVQTDKTREAIVEFMKELKDLSGVRPITATELEEAKANRMRGFAQQFESLKRVGSMLSDLWLFNLPFSELRREQDEIASATLESVNQAASKYASISNSILLVVGDWPKIEKQTKDLGIGEIIILDEYGSRDK